MDLELGIIGYELVGVGTETRVSFTPKSLLSGAIKSGASYIITAHNHVLAYSVKPSQNDRMALKNIKKYTENMEIPLIADIIVNGNNEFFVNYSNYSSKDWPDETYNMIQVFSQKVRVNNKISVIKRFLNNIAFSLLIQILTIGLSAFLLHEVKVFEKVTGRILIVLVLIVINSIMYSIGKSNYNPDNHAAENTS